MTEALSGTAFVLALLLYAASSALFYGDIARPAKAESLSEGKVPVARRRLGAWLLASAALGHGAYVCVVSLVAHVCPIHSVHFFLSVASLFATSAYLVLRRRFRIDALGLLVGPLGLAFLLGTYFLGKPMPEPHLSPVFITFHVMANLLGIALFLLAGGSAALYLIQEKRIKQKKVSTGRAVLPPLDTLDNAVHRFLILGFPLLTLGIISGTYWAQKLELGSSDEVMRAVFGYSMWLLIAGVLLLRAAAGWRGRRAAYGTLAGLVCAGAVLIIYLVRPMAQAVGG